MCIAKIRPAKGHGFRAMVAVAQTGQAPLGRSEKAGLHFYGDHASALRVPGSGSNGHGHVEQGHHHASMGHPKVVQLPRLKVKRELALGCLRANNLYPQVGYEGRYGPIKHGVGCGLHGGKGYQDLRSTA